MTMIGGRILDFLVMDALVFSMKLLSFLTVDPPVPFARFDAVVLVSQAMIYVCAAGMIFLPSILSETRPSQDKTAEG